MNGKMKKLMASALLGSLVLLAGCGTPQQSEDSKDVKTIGISQFAQHESLDDCKKGFIEGLKEEGFEVGKNLKINDQNAQADPAIANQIATQFLADKPDMVMGIATISAQALFNGFQKSDTPVIFTAISDPIAAGLAKEDGSPTGNITGTSDKLPLDAQMEMIHKLLPKAKKVGILYSTSEVNSESQIKELKEICPKYGLELVAVGVSTVQDIPAATDNILSQVDCLNNLTDNTVVNALDVVMEKANKKKIPVFGSEIDQLKKGCLASMSIDYVELGKITGKMAAEVLKGKDIKQMNFKTITEYQMVYNEKVLNEYNLKLAPEMDGKAV